MKKSVLIADGDPANQESLSLFLEEEGYCCQVAVDVVGLADMVRSYLFDLVILDFSLSRAPGFPVLHEIRAFGPDTTILILVSYGDYEEAARALDSGADRLIVKPVEFEELLELARSLRSAGEQRDPICD